ncbi:MAG: DoxX family membrane protein [Arhodomonas sp.]|nr:DoxX family membrane protein [Arhodomonas sp.]
MVDERFSPYAVFLLRVALGVMFLAHSVVLKLMTFGLPGTAQFFVSIGLPVAGVRGLCHGGRRRGRPGARRAGALGGAGARAHPDGRDLAAFGVRLGI